MGNLQVRFLEGWAPAMAPGYSTIPPNPRALCSAVGTAENQRPGPQRAHVWNHVKNRLILLVENERPFVLKELAEICPSYVGGSNRSSRLDAGIIHVAWTYFGKFFEDERAFVLYQKNQAKYV